MMVVGASSGIWSSVLLELHAQAFWLRVNLPLAVAPAAGAAVLARWRGRRRWPWWAGVVVVFLLLPNAPYTISDLKHLHDQMLWAPTRDAAEFGVLPIYLLLALAGVLSYSYTLHLLRRELLARRWSLHRRAAAECLVHGACAVGVLLGRIPRLNSWDVADPARVLHGLSVIAGYPGYLLLALAVIASASILTDRLATSVVHATRRAVHRHPAG